MDVQNFIAKYTQLSRFRGVDEQNPVDFVIQPDAQSNNTWMLIVSYLEPTFARVPYNVLWIPMDSTDPNYLKLMRREDHETQTFTYRSAWNEITEDTEIFGQIQYYAPVIEDLALYGIIDPNSGIPNASTSTLGLVRLEPNPANTEEVTYPAVTGPAIEADDPRMSDDRYPNYHEHPDYPRTMIKINDTQYALVNTSFPPNPGMILMLDAVHPEDSNVYIAHWRYPRERDVSFVDRSLVQIEIRGDTSMLEQTSKTYQVWGIFADGQQRQVDPTTFAVTQNQAAASLVASTGVLTAANIQNNETIRMEASYTLKGVTRTAFLDVQIIAGEELESIEIVGPSSVTGDTTTAYTVAATFVSGQIVNVTANVFTTSNTDLTSMAGQSLVVDQTFENGTTQLFASYTFDGTTATDTHDVNIVAQADIPTNLQIVGPSAIVENQDHEYEFLVTFLSGRQETRTAVTSFTKLANENRISIVPPNIVRAGDVPATTTGGAIRLDASLTELGVTVTATKQIDVQDVGLNLAFVSGHTEDLNRVRGSLRLPSGNVISIDPPLEVENWHYDSAKSEAQDATFDFTPYATAFTTVDHNTATFATGRNTTRKFDIFPWKRYINLAAELDHPTYGPLTGDVWSVVRPFQQTHTSGAYVDTSGFMALKIVPVGEDPATYASGTQADPFVLTDETPLNLWFLIDNVWYKHYPKPRPTPVPGLGGNQSTLNPCSSSITHARVSGPNENVFTPVDFALGATVENLPETFTINALNPSADYVGRLTFTMSYAHEVNLTIPPGQPNAGSPLPNLVRTTQFHYLREHVAAPVTLSNLRIRVVGGPDSNASTHTEDQTIQLRYEASYSDAPANWIDVTNRVGSGLTATVRAPANGVTLAANLVDLTLPDVNGNQTTIIDASFDDNGVTRTASYTVTITDANAPVLPTALRIRVVGGPDANASSHNESTALELYYEAQRSDNPGVWVAYTPSADLTVSIDGQAHGSTLDSNKVDLTLGDVTGNQSLALSASLTENGQTVNASYTVTIVDTTVYLNSIRVRLASAPTAGTNASTQDENQTIGLVYQADYTDAVGTFVDITGNAGLSVALGSPDHGATLQNGDTEIVLPDVTGNQNVVINATYVENGVTKTGSYTITIRDNTITLTNFRVRTAAAPNAATNSSTVNEDQTIPVVYQAQFSNAPTTWVDVTNDSRVTAAIVAPANGATLNGKTQVVIPDVSSNVTVTVRGTFNDNGTNTTADYVFNVTDVVITPLELRIRLASNPTAGTNTSTHDESTTVVMIHQARFSDAPGTWVNVNTDPDLTAQIAAPTLGATLTNKTDVALPDVNGNQSIVLNSSLTRNGTTVNANYTINITDNTVPVGITPRWGVAPQQQFQADYSTPAFYNQLTGGTLTGTSPETVTTGNSNDQTQLWYFMYPASWGFLYIQEQGGFAGGWDGGKITSQDGSFGSPAEATIGGVLYYIYRNTFPYGAGPKTWNITYGSSSPDSGTP